MNLMEVPPRDYVNPPIEWEDSPTGKGYDLSDVGYRYYSKRFNRWLTLPPGMWSDGATGFVDLSSTGFVSRVFAWVRNRIHGMTGNLKSAWFFVHDYICNIAKWDDGTPIDNWTASTVAADIVWASGYRWWSVAIWWATYLGGGGEARKNGMRRTNLL